MLHTTTQRSLTLVHMEHPHRVEVTELVALSNYQKSRPRNPGYDMWYLDHGRGRYSTDIIPSGPEG